MEHEITSDTRYIDRRTFSHDLRTPLTVVRGYAELIHRQLAAANPDLQRIAQMNTKLLAQLARLEATIRDTLDDPPHDPPARRLYETETGNEHNDH